MITCKKASALVSQSLDRGLSWRERLGLHLHLMACDICARFKQQAEFLRSALRRNVELAGEGLLLGLSPIARERIRDTLRRADQ